MMPLRFLRSMAGEAVLQLPLRSWPSVRLPSGRPLDMFQGVRAWGWVGGREGGGGGEGQGPGEGGAERGGGGGGGEQRAFHRPSRRPR